MNGSSKVKIFRLADAGTEELINDFLASGIQLMQDGISWLPGDTPVVSFLYREKGVLGSPIHTQLNQVNNEIQNTQKKILANLGRTGEIDIRIAAFTGSEEAKSELIKQKKTEEADLEFNKAVIVKYRSLYAAILEGSIDTLNM